MAVRLVADIAKMRGLSSRLEEAGSGKMQALVDARLLQGASLMDAMIRAQAKAPYQNVQRRIVRGAGHTVIEWMITPPAAHQIRSKQNGPALHFIGPRDGADVFTRQVAWQAVNPPRMERYDKIPLAAAGALAPIMHRLGSDIQTAVLV